jgi:hypothetical protein
VSVPKKMTPPITRAWGRTPFGSRLAQYLDLDGLAISVSEDRRP